MAEDEYELVSKSYLKKLKQENIDLKEQLEKLNSNTNSSETSSQINNSKEDDKNIKKDSKSQEKTIISSNNTDINKIIEIIQKEAAKERESIMENLKQIREINERSLNNSLSKTQDMDSKLESMMINIKELITTISDVIDELNADKKSEVKNIVEDIKNSININITKTLHPNQPRNTEIAIYNKIKEIEVFMKNLRVVLSYVKQPSDLNSNHNQAVINFPK